MSYQEAASQLLHGLVNYTGHPTPSAKAIPQEDAIVKSMNVDATQESDCVHYFVLDDAAIVTRIDIPHRTKSAIILRNKTGKYYWEFEHRHKGQDNEAA